MTRYLILFVIVAQFLVGWPLEATPLDSISRDEAAIAVDIKSLRDERSEVRAAAAEALRLVVAKYPSRTVYIRSKDGGEAFWTEKINQVKPGITPARN